MPAKKSTKTETTTTPAPQPEPVVEKKQRKSTKTEEKQVVVTVPVATEEATTEKKRREVTKESLDSDFASLEQRVVEEIEKLTSNGKKLKGVKFLRGLKKSLSTLHADANRLTKFKRAGSKKNVSSGFLKPIRISTEMANFLGWDPKESYSRVSVTRNLCQYIKSNKLYNPDDKREILCDAKLRALLKYDPAKAPVDEKTGKPAALTYFRLQQYLVNHFIKNEEVAPVATSTKGKK